MTREIEEKIPFSAVKEVRLDIAGELFFGLSKNEPLEAEEVAEIREELFSAFHFPNLESFSWRQLWGDWQHQAV